MTKDQLLIKTRLKYINSLILIQHSQCQTTSSKTFKNVNKWRKISSKI